MLKKLIVLDHVEETLSINKKIILPVFFLWPRLAGRVRYRDFNLGMTCSDSPRNSGFTGSRRSR
jgi:hypothetical protein